MIHYDLACDRGHRFDGWFRSSADFDAQAAGGLLACPTCGARDVSKTLMAPALSTGRAAAPAAAVDTSSPAAPEEPPAAEVALISERERALRTMLREVRSHVIQNAENVGDRFPDLARRMHAEEIDRRSIYGRASPEEAKALADDGVEVQPLPRFPDDGN